MKLEIISPDSSLFVGESDSVIVPALDGELGILNHHAPLIAALKQGKVRIRQQGSEKTFEIKGGVLEVKQNKVIILAE
jgi:F-type H+-transporting ATPase subunit epsilon